jgi:riboflavin transporter FmnP
VFKTAVTGIFPLTLKGERRMNTMMNTQQTKKAGSTFSIRSITVIAMLSALATVLMIYDIPLWFAPSFYKIDFSEVPVFIGAFALGPVAGAVIELVKILVNFALTGTETAGIGEVANFLIGCSLVIPGAILYHRKRSKNYAVIGLVIGTISMIIVGSALNAYVLLPTYAKVYGMPMDSLIAMGTAVNPHITNLSTFVLLAVAPFNLLKGAIVSVITIILYKRLSKIIKSFTR